MAKDFTNWHKLKAKLEIIDFSLLFSEKEVWWCSIGVNIGSEEDGKNEKLERPVIIFRKFSHDTFWALPLTSKIKRGKFFYPLEFQNVLRTVMLSQLRILSSRRLQRRIGKISDKQFQRIKRALNGI